MGLSVFSSAENDFEDTFVDDLRELHRAWFPDVGECNETDIKRKTNPLDEIGAGWLDQAIAEERKSYLPCDYLLPVDCK
jgi:hypothetical protein